MGESRDYIGDLRAAREPQELGEALREYGSVLLHERLAVSIVGKPRALAPLVRDELHAIAREALFNCARHANASRVELVLDYGRDSLAILVRETPAISVNMPPMIIFPSLCTAKDSTVPFAPVPIIKPASTSPAWSNREIEL